MIKIYYVPSRKVSREYLLVKQGLVNNSRVELVDSEKESDFIFLCHATLKHDPHLSRAFPSDKTVFIDYHDKSYMVFDIDCLAYFKRSWVEMVRERNHTTKRPVSRPSHFHPISMAIMDEFIFRPHYLSGDTERDVMLSCTVRPHAKHPNRARLLNFVNKMDIRGRVQIGELNTGHMNRFNDSNMREYFRLLRRSRIVVTCNPSRWEGDHRTWEAFANGALVFIDEMYTPLAHPLIAGKHCIFYDLSDSGLSRLEHRILYFLENPDQAEAIAKAGHDFTMKYHRTSNRIDEILEVIT